MANGTVFGKVIGDALVDHRAVRKEGDEESALLGLGVNLEKVFAGEDFAAGVEQPETAGVDEFVEKAAMLFEGEFLGAGGVVAHRQVVVAVKAVEGATAGDLNRHLERRALSLEALVNQARQFAVCCGFQSLAFPSELPK